ncbi:MAG: triose-phosphate isomerase [Thermodesulfobacteriota bacterium]|nr:triose-phosphate isomerase [Thermodesulfobacteriota bacterium]
METRRPFIAGNWKMFKTCDEAEQSARELASLVTGATDRDIMIAPAFTSLWPVSRAVAGSNVAVGGQNLHWETEGAFTGEISAAMLTSAGCEYVIIGHSERRQFFNETDEAVNKKIQAAAAAGLKPVMCIGESEAERDAKKTFSVLDKQVKNGLKGLVLNDVTNLTIAYEPVWAIGTGKTATSDQAQEAHAYIRNLVQECFDAAFAGTIRILYGGSVKPANIAELMSMDDIDGALVGGASLEAKTFAEIVKF